MDGPHVEIRPVGGADRASNPLRPTELDAMIGQARLKALLRRVIDMALYRYVTLDHILLVGPAGVGKTTVGTIIANELGVDCFQVEAPISHDTLMALRDVMRDRDVLFIDEIHQQAIMERRGRSTSTQPEVLYQVLEDKSIVTTTGISSFPDITVVGATTDEGMLPDPFVTRFPLRPALEPYTPRDLCRIALANAQVLGVRLDEDAAIRFATASRGTPRQVNNYVRNGAMLSTVIDDAIAEEVVRDLNATTDDGLTIDMQRTLVFIFQRGKRRNKATGDVTYQASVDTIATAIGKSRDSKAVKLRVEPYLIERGYLQVGHGGRFLTAAGIKRARKLAATV
jgi:holliday junction DNA helicase RuvB